MSAPETSRSRCREQLDDGAEFAFTPRDFRDIAELLHDESGISLSDAKAPLVYSRLAKRLRILRLATFADYCALVRSEAGADERRLMVIALTTNVTRFFREPHHFDHFKAKVLPSLISQARRGERVRIWSAGCSSGEEPYSIALTLMAAFPDAARHDVKILATDIDEDMLRQGRGGRYASAAGTPVPAPLKERWLKAVPGRGGDQAWLVHEDVRALVAFRELNLMDEWPMKGPFQTIFCRNVAIYFDVEVRARLWRRLADLLTPAGHLYIGHSERLSADITDMYPVALTVYQRSERV